MSSRTCYGGQEVRVFRWIPIDEEIPKGWKLARNAHPSHHNHFSILIEANREQCSTASRDTGERVRSSSGEFSENFFDDEGFGGVP